MTHYQTLHAHTISFWLRILGLSVVVHMLGIAFIINTEHNNHRPVEMTSRFNVVLETQQRSTKPVVSDIKKKPKPSPQIKQKKNIIKQPVIKSSRRSKLKSTAVVRKQDTEMKLLTENKPDNEIDQQQQLAYISPRIATELNNRKPYYPQVARRRGMQGNVLLQVRVGIHGEVLDVIIKQSSGYHLLDSAAKEAIEQWQFQPAQRGSKFETGSIEIPVRFNLQESG